MGKTLLITHNDLDGAGCAIATYIRYGIDNTEVRYIPVHRVDKELEDVLYNSTLGLYERLIVADVFPKNLGIIKKFCIPIEIFDHHDTSYSMVTNNKHSFNGSINIDTTKSATKIMFEKYGVHIRPIIEDIDNYDMGRFNLDAQRVNTVAFNMGISEFALKYANELLLTLTKKDVIIADAILAENTRYIEHKLPHIKPSYIFGAKGAVIFSDRAPISQLTEELKGLDYDFLAVVNIDNRSIALRALNDDFNCLTFLSKLCISSGGHKKAAGGKFKNLKKFLMNF